MEPERLLSWRWHPYAIDPAVDYSAEPTTLVEFHLSDVAGGTGLAVIESGFDRVPLARLTAGSDVTRQAITKHLNVLAEAGLVESVRRGRERIWEIDVARLEQAGRYLEQISKRWDETLDRLRRFVED
jgi:DNA-binding transcriptional ArsR family regulator